MSVAEAKSSLISKAKTTAAKYSAKESADLLEKLNKIAAEGVQDDHIESDSDEPNIYDKVYSFVGKAASTDLGQYAIQKFDGLLSVIEKTAKWSVPEQTESSKNSKPLKLERPCGWLPFLSLIIALRFTRIGLSIASLMIGNDPVSAQAVVYFLQTRRRKLRYIKYQGMKAIRLRQKAAKESAKRTGIVQKLTCIFNLVICRPGRSSECAANATADAAIENKNKKSNSSAENNKVSLNTNKQPEPAQKRPLEQDDDSANDTDSDDGLDCTQMLAKYGGQATDADSDDVDFDIEAKEEDTSDTDDDEDAAASEQEIPNLEALQQKLKLHNDTTDSMLAEDSTLKENGLPSMVSFSEDQKMNKSAENGDKSSMNKSNSLPSPADSQQKTITSTFKPVHLSPQKIVVNGSNNVDSGDDEISEQFYDPIEVYDYDPKRGLRVRCRDLSRLSASSEECFYSPIASPSLSDECFTSVPQMFVPTVVADTVASNELLEKERANTTSANGVELPAASSKTESTNPTQQNNVKPQNNHQQQHKHSKRGHHNNFRSNRGRRVR